ncbi:MAG: tetratricopeptide repeat-containing sensor histidine kinase [Cyclobacteriaceae bacterium]
MVMTKQAYAQVNVKDSLEQFLKGQSTIDEVYLDAFNELTFEYIKANPGEGINMANRAIRMADSIDYQKGMMRALTHKGSGFWINGLFDHALKHYLQALTLLVEDDYLGKSSLYNNIGETYKKQQQYDSALMFFQKGREVVLKSLKGRYPSILSYNIGELYFLQGKIDSAKKYYDIASHFAELDKNDRGKAYASFGKGEIAYVMGDLNQAIKYHRESLSIRRLIDDKRGIVQSLFKLSDYYFEQGDKSRSEILLNEAEFLSTQFQDLLYEAYLRKAEYYRSTEYYRQSNDYIIKYRLLKDSLDKESVIERIKTIQEALEAEIQSGEIALLEEQNQLQEESIKNQIIVITSILIGLVILGAYLFQYYRNLRLEKERSTELKVLNRLIREKNTEIKEINKNLDSQLIQTHNMLVESQRVSKIGGWEYNVQNDELSWTVETSRQIGLEPYAEASLDAVRKFFGSQQYSKIRTALKKLWRTGQKQSILVRSIKRNQTSESSYIKIEMMPEVVNGQIQKVYGSSQDVTEDVLIEKREQEILNVLMEFNKRSDLRSSTFEEFVGTILYRSIELLNIWRGNFWLFDPEQNTFHLFKQTRDKSSALVKLSVDDIPNFYENLIQNRTVAMHHTNSDSRSKELKTSYFDPNNISSALYAQVRLEGHLVGFLGFEKQKTSKKWNYSEQRFAGSIADIVSTGYSSFQSKKLLNENDQLIDQLKLKNQSLEEFAFVISHNLREPVAQIIGLSHLYDPKDTDHNDEVVDRIKNASGNLDKVLYDLSQIVRSNIDEQSKSTFLLEKEIENVLSSLSDEISRSKANISLNFDQSIEVHSVQPMINNVLTQLISNALKFRNQATPCEISITATNTESTLSISVHDNGLGIDLERFRSKIFHIYQRFHLNHEGRGIGLFIARSQTEQLGGTIEVESRPQSGSTFTIQLPK